MLKWRDVANARFVFTKGELGFKDVVEDFKSSKRVDIVTFNISARGEELLQELNELNEDTEVVIVTNIPSRWDNYLSYSAKDKAKKNIKVYMNKLDPDKFSANINSFFNFSNHSKIIATDSKAYIGSANYSDESTKNYEAGFIVEDTEFVQFIREEILPGILSESEYYYKNEFIEFKLATLSIYNRLMMVYSDFFSYGFYIENDFGKKIYNISYQVNVEVNDLEEVQNILNEIRQLLRDIEEKYSEIYDESTNQEILDEIDIEESNYMIDEISELIMCDSEIYNLCNFDYQSVCDDYLEEHSLEAYDEYLDEYASKASNNALETYETQAEDTQIEIDQLENKLETIINKLWELSKALEKAGYCTKNINETIDNAN